VRVQGVARSAQRIPTAVNLDFLDRTSFPNQDFNTFPRSVKANLWNTVSIIETPLPSKYFAIHYRSIIPSFDDTNFRYRERRKTTEINSSTMNVTNDSLLILKSIFDIRWRLQIKKKQVISLTLSDV
jgi:hypothetical protein